MVGFAAVVSPTDNTITRTLHDHTADRYFPLVARKGSRNHKELGYTWAGLMLAASALSFGIHNANGGFSFAHFLAVLTFLFVPLSVFLARRKLRLLHRITVLSTILFFQIGAGIGAFVPRRALGETETRMEVA